jgi:uncharacterized protein (TIGR03905 family)
MIFKYRPQGVCSQEITLDIDDNHIIRSCSFYGGCSGNTQGVSRLVTGQKAEDVIAALEGIRCGPRPTSCPDQLSKALKKAIEV